MELVDIFKLIYQNNFGCGHLVSSQSEAYDRISSEIESIEPLDTKLVYDIGNGYSRLDLKAVKYKGIDTKLISRIFYLSSQETKLNLDSFYNDINLLREMSDDNQINFSKKDIHSFIKKWEDEGRLPFSHSENYRKKYNPAYRVILKKYADFIELLDRIEKQSRDNFISVAIDGRCGSGKTTLGNLISEIFCCDIIHADDFFLPLEKRTENRLSEAGGNFDYERFNSQVIDKIKSKEQSFAYDVFSCCEMKFIHKKRVSLEKLLVIEGSYCLHPYLDDIYDIKVFKDVSTQLQKERIIKRNGKECFKRFEEKWIPMEEKYFNEYSIKQKCNFVY